MLRADGTPCDADEPGELVHRGALVGMGYWNDAEKTAERYKPLPSASAAAKPACVLPEMAVFSGDTVRTDERRLPVLHRPPRRDDQDLGLPRQPDRGRGSRSTRRGWSAKSPRSASRTRRSGRRSTWSPTPPAGVTIDVDALARRVPQAPAGVHGAGATSTFAPSPLPRNPNGKIDRKTARAAELRRARVDGSSA